MSLSKSKIEASFGISEEDFPEYLRSYEALSQYFRAQLQSLNTTEKGDRFAHAASKLIPQTDIGPEFDYPTLNNKKSRDEGIDLIATGKENKNRHLYIQAKLWIDRAETIDSILSKFQSYNEADRKSSLGQLSFNFNTLDSVFMVITLSPLKTILAQYEKKAFSSKPFYHQIMQENRLHFIDGYQILSILKAAYSKVNKINTKIVLELEADFIHKDDVYIGITSSVALKDLYNHMGDALFFENIRDFLGVSNQERVGRKTPNNEIIKTVTNHPDKLLSRNNGIVFSASKVEQGNSACQLVLHNGSVVNGCQTTMCIVENAKQECYVLVKVVEITESWDIATAANYQNSVADIDLELAQYLRPQLVKKAAALSGVQVDDTIGSPFHIIEEIYDRKIAYDETRLIYIGLFSRTPTNVFIANYTELLQDLLQKFYEDDKYGERIFDILFALQSISQEGLKLAEDTFKDPSYSKMFERLYSEESLTYRCFICILALCSFANVNIAERNAEPIKEYERMRYFFREAQKLMGGSKDEFLKYYLYAVKVWMQEMNIDAEPTEIQQSMHRRSRRLNFGRMFRDVRMEKDLQESVQKL